METGRGTEAASLSEIHCVLHGSQGTSPGATVYNCQRKPSQWSRMRVESARTRIINRNFSWAGVKCQTINYLGKRSPSAIINFSDLTGSKTLLLSIISIQEVDSITNCWVSVTRLKKNVAPKLWNAPLVLIDKTGRVSMDSRLRFINEPVQCNKPMKW